MDLSGARVAVTGAGGFIGGALSRRLVADGAEVIGLDRDRAAAARVKAAGAQFELCDTRDPGVLRAALDGADAVAHTAAIVGEWGAMRDFVEVNVRGTRNVLDAAEAAGVSRVVHVSSVASWGYEFRADISEDALPRPCGVPYVDTKAASDQLALRRGAAVVRPGDVYGPGSVQWVLRPLAELRARRFRVPSDGGGWVTPVYLDDLVDCIVRALGAGGAGGWAVTAWDGHAVRAVDYFARIARMLGLDAVPTAPRAVLAAAAGVIETGARLLGRTPPISRHTMMFISRRAVYPNEHAREVLGWEPQVDLDEGMRRTEAWLRAEGALP